MIMNIYVGNLSVDAKDEMIKQAFEAFGQVTSAKVIKDKYTGQSKAFAFVEMPVESQAHTAIKSLNGKEIMGKQIIVQQAHDSAGMGRQGGRMEYNKSKSRY
jgi:RNA recognition motif-containing protein